MKLIMQNFRVHDLFEIEFQDVTSITGKTGEGKTSILEAMVFALYNKDFFGGTGTDRFIKTGATDATVVLYIPTGGEEVWEIKRVVTKKGSELYINGGKGRQEDIDIKFGTLGKVLPMINPFYFMSMDDSDKRELFMSLLPQENRKDIFIRLYGERLADRFAISTEKKVKDEYKQVCNTLQQNEILVRQLIEQIKLDKGDIAQLEKEVVPIPDGEKADATGREKIQQELNDIDSKLIRLGEVESNLADTKLKVEALIEDVRKVLSLHGGAKLSEAIELWGDKYAKGVETRNALQDELSKLQGQLNIYKELFKTGICPTCGQRYDPTHTKRLIESIEPKIQSVVNTIKDVDSVKESAKNIYDQLVGFKIKGSELQTLKQRLEQDLPVYIELVNRKKDLQEVLSKSGGEAFAKSVEVSSKVEILSRRINDAQSKIKNAEEVNPKLLEQQADLEVLIEAFGSKGVVSEVVKAQVKQLEQIVSKYMKVRIEALRENKTTEGFKEVFDVFIDDVEYKSLSFGERIRVATAFSLSIRTLYEQSALLPVLLLDEASVLSKVPMGNISKWCEGENIKLIYTKISDSRLSVKSTKYELGK